MFRIVNSFRHEGKSGLDIIIRNGEQVRALTLFTDSWVDTNSVSFSALYDLIRDNAIKCDFETFESNIWIHLYNSFDVKFLTFSFDMDNEADEAFLRPFGFLSPTIILENLRKFVEFRICEVR